MRGPCDCDPEMVFELADGALPPARKREIQKHLEACPECQELYQREVDLNVYLESLEISGARSRSVCQGVAMALPTRPVKVRLLWGMLALALLFAALVALDLNGTNPVTAATSVVDVFWSLASGVAGLAVTIFSMAGPVILIALALGAVADLVIAAAVLSAARRSSRQV